MDLNPPPVTTTDFGKKSDVVAPDDTTAQTFMARAMLGLQRLGTIVARLPALVSGRMPVDGSGVTQPVSAASLPLPSGAATSAKQDTGNTSLASIDGKLPAAIASNSTVSSVAATTSVATILAANAARKGRPSVHYDGAAILYLLVGTGTPSSTNYTLKMGAGYYTYYEPPVENYTGALAGIWSAASGSALVTELS